MSGICPRLVGSWWWDPKRTPAFPSQLGKNPKAAVLPVCDRSLSAGFCQGALRIPPAALTSEQPPGCRVFPCAPSPPLYNFPPSLLGAEAEGVAVAVPAAFWGAGELTAAWNLPISSARGQVGASSAKQPKKQNCLAGRWLFSNLWLPPPEHRVQRSHHGKIHPAAGLCGWFGAMQLSCTSFWQTSLYFVHIPSSVGGLGISSWVGASWMQSQASWGS